MHMIVLYIISYLCIVPTLKSKDKVFSLKGSLYRQEVCIMMRLGYLLVLLAFTLGSMQMSDGKELRIPISDVMKTFIELEKRLLIQEQKIWI